MKVGKWVVGKVVVKVMKLEMMLVALLVDRKVYYSAEQWVES